MLSGWRDDVWRNMLELLSSASAAERAAVIGRMDGRAAAAGAKIARHSTASMWLAGLFSRGARYWHTATAPFSLRLPVPWIAGRRQATQGAAGG